MTTEPHSAAELRAWRAFLHASTRLFDRLDSQLKQEHGRPLSDFDVLSNLAEAPGRSLRMGDLADQTLFSRSRLSHRVGVLESEGLIERVQFPGDGRGKVAVLTALGLQRYRKMRETHLAGIREYFTSQLTPTEQERLAETMSKVATALGVEIVPPL